jgi:hypothetical protein
MFRVSAAARVRAVTDEPNVRSMRVLERTGFKFAERRQVTFKGEACVEAIYAGRKYSFMSVYMSQVQERAIPLPLLLPQYCRKISALFLQPR